MLPLIAGGVAPRLDDPEQPPQARPLQPTTELPTSPDGPAAEPLNPPPPPPPSDPPPVSDPPPASDPRAQEPKQPLDPSPPPGSVGEGTAGPREPRKLRPLSSLDPPAAQPAQVEAPPPDEPSPGDPAPTVPEPPVDMPPEPLPEPPVDTSPEPPPEGREEPEGVLELEPEPRRLEPLSRLPPAAGPAVAPREMASAPTLVPTHALAETGYDVGAAAAGGALLCLAGLGLLALVRVRF